MGGETDEYTEEDKMKWRNWEVVFWMHPTAWMWNKGVYPNERTLEFYFWNILFIEIRKHLK